MKKTVISILILSVVLLATVWQPVLASSETEGAATTKTPKLSIQNKTGEAFYFTLTGPKYYNLYLPKNKSVHEVEQGKYTYSYYACGATQTGTVNVKKNGVKLTLKCPKSSEKNAKTPKLTITNKTGETIRITLTGPKTYAFSVPKNKSTQEIQQGKYTYSYYACGATQTGTVNVKKNGAKLTLKCPKSSENKVKLVKITINNKTGGNITMELTGPETYRFSLGPGKSKIELVKGRYDYTVWGCGSSLSGTRNFKNSFIWTFWCH